MKERNEICSSNGGETKKVAGKCMKHGSKNSMKIDYQTQDDEDAHIPKASLHDV